MLRCLSLFSCDMIITDRQDSSSLRLHFGIMGILCNYIVSMVMVSCSQPAILFHLGTARLQLATMKSLSIFLCFAWGICKIDKSLCVCCVKHTPWPIHRQSMDVPRTWYKFFHGIVRTFHRHGTNASGSLCGFSAEFRNWIPPNLSDFISYLQRVPYVCMYILACMCSCVWLRLWLFQRRRWLSTSIQLTSQYNSA